VKENEPMTPTDPYSSARKAVAKSIKQAGKRGKKSKVNLARRMATEASDMPARVKRIVSLEKEVAKKGLSEEERRGLHGQLLQSKLAATEELSRARAAQRAAQMRAIGAAINHGPHDPRAQVASVRDQTYTREAPIRSQTEQPSQTRMANGTAATIAGLAKQLRKSTDPLERARLGDDLTFEKLRAAHRAGRI
jgi:hypothetical protein